MNFALSPSGPLRATQHGQVFEGLDIFSEQGPALEVEGLRNVVIRRCRIWHRNGTGLRLASCRETGIEHLEIIHCGAPSRGPLQAEECNLEAWNCDGLDIRAVRLWRGSSGLYLTDCRRVHIQHIEGYDFRGPFPRGQLLQFNRVTGARAQHFFALNPPDSSFPEDIISVFESRHVQLLDGLLVGNNAPTGVGVMFERSCHGRVLRVDAWHMGNGCFSAYPAEDVQFIQVRAARNHRGDQGRGVPQSGGLCFASSAESRGVRVLASNFDQICDPNRLRWGRFERFQAEPQRIQPRSLPRLRLPWEEVGASRG